MPLEPQRLGRTQWNGAIELPEILKASLVDHLAGEHLGIADLKGVLRVGAVDALSCRDNPPTPPLSIVLRKNW